MANAIKKISVQRGYDVTRYALNCFGGAGGQHACLVADALGMTRVLIHPFSSLLSAYGMGLADIRATRQQAIELAFGAKALAALKRDRRARSAARRRPKSPARACRSAKIKVFARAHIRYAGTDTALVVAGRHPARDEARLREGAQSALRLHRPHQADGGRGGVGRSGRRRRQVQREGGRRQARQAAAAGAAHASSSRPAPGTRPTSTRATSSSPATRQRRRHHHRAAPDHRGRARLAGRADARRIIWC